MNHQQTRRRSHTTTMELPTNILLSNQNKTTKQIILEESENELNARREKCEMWLEKCAISDDCSVYSDSNSSVLTDTTTNSGMDSGLVLNNNGIVIADRIISNNNDGNTELIIQEYKDSPKYDNVNIYKSKKVHVGDVTYINGPVIISNSSSAYNDTKLNISYTEQPLDIFIVDRLNWLAQPPLGEREYTSEPVKYVVIAHTATEEGFTQADNTLLVRLIQTFHVESRKWKDIAYNFLIGSDGLAYEGRGWGVIGSHTRNYNCKSVGIAFIGCFIDHLPSKVALKKAQDLIEAGIKRGSIATDYKLLAHCQCTAIESPGRRLFEEIQTWDHWDKSVAVPKSNFTCVFEEPPDDPDVTETVPESKVTM